MATGTSTFMGLGMGLQGEYELTQQVDATDCFTITGASTSGAGTLFTIQSSDKAPGTNGLRVWDYGRTRIFRTDATSHGGAYKNALDVKYDIDYAMGAVQAYAATFILDIADGSVGSGRSAVLALQSYGNTTTHVGVESSWFYLNDLGATETTEMGSFINFGGQTISSTNMLQGLSSPSASHGLVIYWENTKYWILVSSVST